MDIVCIIERNYSVEKKLHNIFAHKNIGGEWFDLSESDLIEISKLKESL